MCVCDTVTVCMWVGGCVTLCVCVCVCVCVTQGPGQQMMFPPHFAYQQPLQVEPGQQDAFAQNPYLVQSESYSFYSQPRPHYQQQQQPLLQFGGGRGAPYDSPQSPIGRLPLGRGYGNPLSPPFPSPGDQNRSPPGDQNRSPPGDDMY